MSLLILEISAGAAALTYGWKKFRAHRKYKAWLASYPRKGVTRAQKGRHFRLSREPWEHLVIENATYDKLQVTDWIRTNMEDSTLWEMLVLDEFMPCGITPEKAELAVSWRLEANPQKYGEFLLR